MPADFRARVVAALRSVGPGQVVSYGDLAAQAGYPGAARGVGAVLAGSRPEEGLTWWRVIYSDGRLAPGKEAEQGRLLAREGIETEGGRVRPGSPAAGPQPGRPAADGTADPVARRRIQRQTTEI